MDLAQIDGLRHPGARNLPTKEPPKHTGSRGVGCRERCLRGSNASSPSRGTQYPPEDAAGRCAMDQQHESQSPSAKIATSAVQVLHEYTGRGPTKAKTTIEESVVTILLADTLTTGERTLVEHGHSDRVLQVRYDYQTTMRDGLVGIVEQEIERKVIAFLSQNHIDPDLAVEVFGLEPADAVQRISATPELLR